MQRVTDPPAILLVRLDGVGDAALCVPALQGLSERYPGARFGAVCSSANAQLFSEKVERIYVCDSRQSLTLCVAQVKTGGYTHAMVATEEVAGYALAKASGAKIRVGFWHGLQKPFKSLWQSAQLTRRVHRPARGERNPEHEVASLYRLATELGAELPPPSDPQALRTWLNVESPSNSAPSNEGTTLTQPPDGLVIGFQITPKLLVGGWGPAALAELIVTTLRVSGLERVTLLASAQDEGLASAVMEQVPTAARTEGRIALVSSLPLPRWLGQLAGCTVLVTPDTGAAHVAGMLGVPVIDIFEPDVFVRLAQRWQPWAGPFRCVVKPRWRASEAALFGAGLAASVRELTA